MEIGSSAVWIVIAIYILMSTFVVATLPTFIAPLKSGLSSTEEIEALDLQNKVRQTVIQICGGIGFLFSVLMALNSQESSNKDLKAKYDRETAELFVKAVESESPEALYALAYVAQRDTKNYHEVIFRMLSSLIRSLSSSACGDDSESREKATAKIQVALQLLHERPVENDPNDIRYNIEHSCLNGSDLLVESGEWGRYHGLANIRASGAQMLRIDFTRTELQKAEFMGITAGDWHNQDWESEPHRYELHDLDAQGEPKWKALRRKYTAHFVDANLTGAKLSGAGLEGADFSGAKLGGANFDGANISRTNFRGAQNLKVEQFRYSCAGTSSDPKIQKQDQPIFDDAFKADLQKAGGIPPC
jgi:uncharacterized protein YjbI with pentapeptide repeats